MTPNVPGTPGASSVWVPWRYARPRSATEGRTRLALAQRDVAVAEVEVTREGDLEAFADPERAVRLDVDGDVPGEEREAVRARETRCGERDDHRAREDEHANAQTLCPPGPC